MVLDEEALGAEKAFLVSVHYRIGITLCRGARKPIPILPD
jgi:hypothetical protein